VLAAILLILGAAEHSHHPEFATSATSKPSISQPALPAKDEPGEREFRGPSKEWELRWATPTKSNGLVGALGEARMTAEANAARFPIGVVSVALVGLAAFALAVPAGRRPFLAAE